jgi:hypothetical protein
VYNTVFFVFVVDQFIYIFPLLRPLLAALERLLPPTWIRSMVLLLCSKAPLLHSLVHLVQLEYYLLERWAVLGL